MCITTVNAFRNMIYQFSQKQPKQFFKAALNRILDEKPSLKIAFDRNSSHPLNGKNCHIPT